MGCWNGTCMISRLPIYEGDDIKLVITMKMWDLSGSSFCYSDEVYKPAFLPLEGKYNDYGMIEDIKEDFNLKLIMEYLKYKYPIINDNEDYSIYDFLECIERDNIKDGNGNDINISFVMIHKYIYDSIVNDYVGEFWNDRKEFLPNGDRKYYITANEYIDRKLNFNNFKDEHITFLSTDIVSRKLYISYIYINLIRDTVKSNDISLFNNFKIELGNLIKLYSFMGDTRISWMIQCGAGSQSNGQDSYEFLINSMKKLIDKQKNRYEE